MSPTAPASLTVLNTPLADEPPLEEVIEMDKGIRASTILERLERSTEHQVDQTAAVRELAGELRADREQRAEWRAADREQRAEWRAADREQRREEREQRTAEHAALLAALGELARRTEATEDHVREQAKALAGMAETKAKREARRSEWADRMWRLVARPAGVVLGAGAAVIAGWAALRYTQPPPVVVEPPGVSAPPAPARDHLHHGPPGSAPPQAQKPESWPREAAGGAYRRVKDVLEALPRSEQPDAVEAPAAP